MSSLTSSAVSSAVAGAGFFFLACTLVALGTTPRNCSSEKEDLSSLPYLEYYYSIYEDKDCLRAGVSITVSSFRLNILSCEISLSPVHIISAFSAVSCPIGLMSKANRKKHN
jgi:hypothetical protein